MESTTSLEVGAVTVGTLKETALPLPLPSAVGVDEEVDAVASVLGLASFEADAEVRQIMAELKRAGIDSRPFFHPLSSLPAYGNHPSVADARRRNKVSYEISAYGLNLPSGLQLTESHVDRVASAVRAIIRS